MKTVGMFEAKTHFSELVADAMNGETTVVTKNGKPVAEIAPVRAHGREHVRETFERIKKLALAIRARNGRSIPWQEVKEWINEGRRFQ